MLFCIEHQDKAYTEKQFEHKSICQYAGSYQDVKDRKVRVYCFAAMYQHKCEHKKYSIADMVECPYAITQENACPQYNHSECIGLASKWTDELVCPKGLYTIHKFHYKGGE